MILTAVLGIVLTCSVVAFVVAARIAHTSSQQVKVLTDLHAQAERDMEQRDHRLGTILAAARVGIWEWDRQTGPIWTSPSLLEMLGYAPGERPQGLQVADFHPDDLGPLAKQFREGWSHVFGEPEGISCRLRHKDGSYHLMSGTTIVAERGGREIRVGALFDQTDLHAEREAAALALEDLEYAAQAAQVAFWEREIESGRYRTSANFSEIHGFEPDQWLEKLAATKDGAAKLQEVRAREPGPTVSVDTWRVPFANGDVRSIQTRSRVSERNGVKLVSSVNFDVTDDQQQVERLAELNGELQRSNMRMAEFSRVVSHDLRSPLRAIGSLVSFIREDGGEHLDAEILGHLDKIDERVRRSSDLLDDLLEYSRVGGSAGHLALVDPVELVTGVLAMVETAPGVESVIECETDPFWAEAIPLGVCVRNLVDNAHKHHGGESGTVVVSIRQADSFVVIDVADDGQGIDERYHEQVFEPFRSLAPASESTGSGIGLSVIRRTVEKRGGTIDLRSSPGSGANFRLRWPISGARDEARDSANVGEQ